MKSIVKTMIFALAFVGIFSFPLQTSASLSMAVTNVYATPSTVDFSTRPSVSINYYTNTEGYVTLEIFKGSDKVGTFVENQFVGIGNHAYYWNGKYGSGADIGGYGESVEGGTYTFKINATGTNQTSDSAQGTITVSAPATSETGVSITESSADKDSFDPWKSQNIKINFEIDAAAKVTIKILNQNGGLIKTLASSKSYSKGSHSITWNGKNTSGSIVEEGDYKYTINAVAGLHQDDDQGEFSVEKGAVVTAGTKVPDIEGVYVTKEDFDPDWEYTHIVFNLTAQADLKISIYKNNDLVEALYDEKNQKSGLYKIMWEGNKNTGNYTYKIEAENSKGKDSYTEDIKISEEKADEKNAPNIYKDQIDIDDLPYSAKEGALTIYFKLDKDADKVTVEIRKDGKTIKTIMDDEELEKGSHSVDWDGKNKSGLSVAGGVYEYRITAEKSSKEDVERGYFSVKTSASTGGQSGKCAGFADVLASYNFCDAIAWAKEQGVFQGYSDGSFKPYQPIRRSEILKVVIESFKIPKVGTNGGNLGFKDVQGYEWFMNYLATGIGKGLAQGYSDKTFKPYEQVTRAQALKIMFEGAKSKFGFTIPTNNFGYPYLDVPPATWYTKYAWLTKNNNLIDNENYLSPTSPMTRGEMADILYRFDKAGLAQ